MLSSAADATLNVMVEDLNAIEPVDSRTFRLEAVSLEMLLFDLLQELIFYKDAEELLLRVPQIAISRQKDRFVLTAEACGETIDVDKHQLLVDVKAVTLHHFHVQQNQRGWTATVVLDI
jgi:SHS2 domain-containing protein